MAGGGGKGNDVRSWSAIALSERSEECMRRTMGRKGQGRRGQVAELVARGMGGRTPKKNVSCSYLFAKMDPDAFDPER